MARAARGQREPTKCLKLLLIQRVLNLLCGRGSRRGSTVSRVKRGEMKQTVQDIS